MTALVTTVPVLPRTGRAEAASHDIQEAISTLRPGEHAGSFEAGSMVSATESLLGQTIIDPGGSAYAPFSDTPRNVLTLAIPGGDGLWLTSGSSASLADETGCGDIGEDVVSMLFSGARRKLAFLL